MDISLEKHDSIVAYRGGLFVIVHMVLSRQIAGIEDVRRSGYPPGIA